MKQLLQKYADRIDAMSLRERAMVFLAVAFALVMLLQNLLLEPVLSRQKQLSAQIVQRQNEMKLIQIQIQALVQPKKQDQDALNRAKLESLREQMVQLDRQFEERQKQFVAPEKIAAMLEQMLRKNRQLQMLSLNNLPGSSMSQPGTAAAGASGGAREIFRHAVVLSIGGSYFDLLDYLVALERMQEHLFWGGVELSVVEYPRSVLRLTVYTLSLEKSWLTV